MARNLCLLILCSCNLFASENFWFSYRVVTENKSVIYEQRYLSPHMTPLQEKLKKVICKTNIKKNTTQSTLKLLNENFDELLHCFYPMNAKVLNRTLVENSAVLELTDMNIRPIEFTVDFKDQFANITIIIPD